jgi:aspartyl aminopeptidase
MHPLQKFLQTALTPWHVCHELVERLKKQGAKLLQEEESWKLLPGQKYIVQRGASIIAFQMPIKACRSAFDRYPITLAPLALHLDQKVNADGLKVHKQEHLSAIVCRVDELPKKTTFLQLLFGKRKVVHFELFATVDEPSYTLGKDKELLAAPRLDNLSCLLASFEAFLEAKPKQDAIQMLALWNHEEIGSETAEGACSSFFGDVLERIAGNREEFMKIKAKSQALSLDVGHAAHPNFSDKLDPRHAPTLGSGVILKLNANEKYRTDGWVAAEFIALLKKKKIPHATYIARTDMLSGSTVGPPFSAALGIQTCDTGLSLLSMHASQELISLRDYEALNHAISGWL